MKKINLILSIVIALILIATYAYATVDATISAEASKASLNAGDEFEVSIALKDLEYTNKGVDEVELAINIKEDIIEPLTVNSIKTTNGSVTIGNNTLKVEDVSSAESDEVVFSSLTNDCDYKIFIDLKNAITETNTDLITLKCKIKSDLASSFEKGVDVEDAITVSANIATQVTAQDLVNGMTADIIYSVRDVVPLTVTGATKPANDNSNANKNTNNNSNKNNSNKNNSNNTPANGNKNNGSGSGNPGGTSGGTSGGSTSGSGSGSGSSSGSGAGSSSSSGSGAGAQTTTTKTPATATTAKTSLPAAGWKVFIAPIIIAVVIVIASYQRYNKYKDIQ